MYYKAKKKNISHNVVTLRLCYLRHILSTLKKFIYLHDQQINNFMEVIKFLHLRKNKGLKKKNFLEIIDLEIYFKSAMFNIECQ